MQLMQDSWVSMCPWYCPLLQQQRTHCTAMAHIAATQRTVSLPPSPEPSLTLPDTINYNECYHQHLGLIEDYLDTKWISRSNYISHQLDADDRSARFASPPCNLFASAHSPDIDRRPVVPLGSSMSLCCREASCSSEHYLIWYGWCTLMLRYIYKFFLTYDLIVKASLCLIANCQFKVTLLCNIFE